MKFKTYNLQLATIIVIILSLTSIGCEALSRKFIRRSKKEKEAPEMVLVPQEYAYPGMDKEQVYRQYFLFWKSWQDELIESLSTSANHKKQASCIKEATNNIKNLRNLLLAAKQKKLDEYISRMEKLQNAITKDIYRSNAMNNRQEAERLKRDILRDFSYDDIMEHLK